MNKKFSTLVAALLLSASVGTFTATALPAASTIEVGAVGNKGYETGKAYLLETATDTYLGIEKQSNGKYQLVKYDKADLSSLSDWSKALWVVSVNDNNGANPIYTFMNKSTQTVLSADLNVAIKNSESGATLNYELGGSIINWQSAPSYKDPKESPIYANVGGDKIVYLKADNSGIYAVRIDAKEDMDHALKITPKKLSKYALSANELNTMLGATLTDATENNYFDLSLNPVIASVFTDSKLQAVAVEHKELKYGSTTDYSKNPYATLVEKKNAFADKVEEYVALKNPQGKYIVADTAYIAGTDNNANGLIKFTTDALYNAKENTRLREPGSYLFKFIYNVSDNTVDIAVKKYVKKIADKSAITTTTTDEETFYGKNATDAYSAKFVKEGSWWNGTVVEDGSVASPSENVYVTRALLGEANYVTLGKQQDATSSTESNKLTIRVGSETIYKPITMAQGAYLLQIADSYDQSRIGKYIVDNLVGGREVVEQVVRQNFQHVPAAQWIVTYTGNATTIVNREFENEYRSGIMYQVAGEKDQAFFFGDGEVLKFIPVADATNDKLGYKYVSDKDLAETRFTFNYLHNLAMDKPINTINNKDSAVWVDSDGESMIFSLVKVADDTYGYNADLKNVAKLNRRVYKIKVNDPSKLKNNNRFLHYDYGQKKYVVSDYYADYFLMKENNEVEDGDCYYTLLNANARLLGKLEKTFGVEKDANDNYFFKKGSVSNVAMHVTDGDENDTYYYAVKGMVINTSGVVEEGYCPTIDLVLKSYYNSSYFAVKTEDEVKALGYTTTEGEDNTVTAVEVDGEIDHYVWTNPYGDEYVLVYGKKYTVSDYAGEKVSVDNNTLALVNGVLSDGNSSEVANSSFSVKPVEDLLYRHFATTDTVKIYRVHSTEKEFLYEDASSKYSKDKNFNFLGVEDKGLTKNSAMYLDTAYVNRGTQMPQYLLALRPEIQKADTILCDATSHKHATKEEALACSHSKVTPAYKKGSYLVSLIDSVAVENGRLEGTAINKYLLDNTRYVRLGFVEATHIADTLIISNSVWTGDNRQVSIASSDTYAKKDTILLNNKHNPAVFSFRKVSLDNDNFLIESESWGDLNGNKVLGETIAEKFAGSIAPSIGGWIKIHNGVPVIANASYTEAAVEAEVFNIEKTTDKPVSVENADASTITVIGGEGYVVVKNATGKQVIVTEVLGKELANTVATSDNAQINVSATGVVFVTVDGEATKVVVK